MTEWQQQEERKRQEKRRYDEASREVWEACGGYSPKPDAEEIAIAREIWKKYNAEKECYSDN